MTKPNDQDLEARLEREIVAADKEAPPKKLRGFAAYKARGGDVSEIARRGGKAAHVAGTAHEFTSDEAKIAGSKGGKSTHEKRRRP